jgi:hypothetical protein
VRKQRVPNMTTKEWAVGDPQQSGDAIATPREIRRLERRLGSGSETCRGPQRGCGVRCWCQHARGRSDAERHAATNPRSPGDRCSSDPAEIVTHRLQLFIEASLLDFGGRATVWEYGLNEHHRGPPGWPQTDSTRPMKSPLTDCRIPKNHTRLRKSAVDVHAPSCRLSLTIAELAFLSQMLRRSASP